MSNWWLPIALAIAAGVLGIWGWRNRESGYLKGKAESDEKRAAEKAADRKAFREISMEGQDEQQKVNELPIDEVKRRLLERAKARRK